MRYELNEIRISSTNYWDKFKMAFSNRSSTGPLNLKKLEIFSGKKENFGSKE